MNGLREDLDEVVALIEAHPKLEEDVQMVLCLPATLIAQADGLAAGSTLAIGAQDCHDQANGANTGDLSAEMLHDAGARFVIVGHSERRRDHGETDALVAAKAAAVLNENMTAIICIGETLAEREAGQTLDVVLAQLDASVSRDWKYVGGLLADRIAIAYEPVWAIGTGRTPTLEQIAEVHDALRARLVARLGPVAVPVPLLYGGSVKPGNAAEIFALKNVNGALVGGASLKAADFAKIVSALNDAVGRYRMSPED